MKAIHEVQHTLHVGHVHGRKCWLGAKFIHPSIVADGSCVEFKSDLKSLVHYDAAQAKRYDLALLLLFVQCDAPSLARLL